MRTFKVPAKEKLIIEDSRKMQRRTLQPNDLHGFYWESILPHLKKYESDPVSWLLVNISADRFYEIDDFWDEDVDSIPLISSDTKSFGKYSDYSTSIALFKTPFDGFTVMTSWSGLSPKKTYSLILDGEEVFATEADYVSGITTYDTPFNSKEKEYYEEVLRQSSEQEYENKVKAVMEIYNYISAKILSAQSLKDLKLIDNIFTRELYQGSIDGIPYWFPRDYEKSTSFAMDEYNLPSSFRRKMQDVAFEFNVSEDVLDQIISESLFLERVFVEGSKNDLIYSVGLAMEIYSDHLRHGEDEVTYLSRGKVISGEYKGLIFISNSNFNVEAVWENDPMLHGCQSWDDIYEVARKSGIRLDFEEEDDSDWG